MKKLKKILTITITAAITFACSDKNYVQKKLVVNKPLVTPKFTPLPIGEVRPQGWILEQCNLAKNGLVGTLDEYHHQFAEGWKSPCGKKVAKSCGWAYEQNGYWIDGILRLGYLLNDTILVNKAKESILASVERLNKTGFLMEQDLYEPYLEAKKWGHWPNAVFGRAMLAYYQATGDKSMLDAIYTIYKDYLKVSDNGKKFDLYHHLGRQLYGIETMLKAYSYGANPELKNIALKLIKSQDSLIQNRLKIHTEDIQNRKSHKDFYHVHQGHGVTVNESTKIPAIAYMWNGNKSYLEVAEKAYDDIEINHMLPNGVHSASEALNGIGGYKPSETCNIIDYSWSNLYLYQITGNSKYGDRIERAFFNAGFGFLSRDYKLHAYYQSPNRINNKIPRKPGPGGSFLLEPSHGVLCCTGNLARLMPNYIMHMLMRSSDNGLAMNLYGPFSAKTVVKGKQVEINCKTQYPFNENLNVSLKTSGSVNMPLYFRVPEWCNNPTISVNNKKIKSSSVNGFIKISKDWRNGDNIEITFPMQPRILNGKTYKGVDFASIYNGPLLFSYPIKDIKPNTPDSAQHWQYALSKNLNNFEVVKNNTIDRSFKSGINLKIKAHKYNRDIGNNNYGIPSMKGIETEEENITLVPYCNSIYRISMFPVKE